LGLHWNDLDLEHGTANITRSLEESSHGGLRMKGTKSGRGRQVVLMQMAVEALRHHKAEQARRRLAAGMGADPEELVVTGPGGGLWRPSNFGAAFAHLIRRSSLPRVTFHALRHSHASLALAAGVHPKIVSERLGHANISITMDTYSHMIPGLQERAVTVMEQTLQAGK
jgi:integrase